MDKGRVCFVSQEGYQVLNPGCDRSHGGAEVQMALLARSFAERGYASHMVTLDHGQPDGERIDSVRVWSAYAPDSGIPVFRFVHPRGTGLLRALSRADADVYIQSCAGMATGISAWFCRRTGAAFAYRVAHDSNCLPGRQNIRYARDRKLFEYGLRRADVIVAQTRGQQRSLERNYGLRSLMGGSLVEPPADHSGAARRSIDVLWVGRIRPVKRPELAVVLGGLLPDRQFRLVGGPNRRTERQFDELKARAEGLQNLELAGYHPYHATRPMFSQARVFLSTAEHEGFPNTYLQAWIAGTPVVAFFDPDGLIARERLGYVVRSAEEAAGAVEDLLSDPDRWRRYSERVRAYALAHHGDTVVDRYETIIGSLMRRSGAAA